jgi:hypothetical protein
MTDNELIQNLDYDGLLVSISKGSKLTNEEVKAIHDLVLFNLKSPREKRELEDLYASLTVLDKASDSSLSYLVAQYLDFQDPLIVSYALEILVIKWSKYEEIKERLIQFSLGMPWDYDQDLRVMSLNCIEHILLEASSTKVEHKKQFKNLIEEIAKEDHLIEELSFQIEGIKSIL